jgi:predicted nucleic acid-binding protein
VDATVVATCTTAGGGVILTADTSDLTALTPAGRAVTVTGLTGR